MKSLITIDGPSGSGKSTLAAQIQDSLRNDGFEVATIHMDDLYDGWDKALDNSLTQSLVKIVDEFLHSPRLTIPQYSWQRSRFNVPITISSPSHLILEGVGSGQRATRPWASIKLWMEAPAEVALHRVLARDGIQIREKMLQWQIREAEYFALEGTKSAADYRVKSAP
jgi:uridine kinase